MEAVTSGHVAKRSGSRNQGSSSHEQLPAFVIVQFIWSGAIFSPRSRPIEREREREKGGSIIPSRDDKGVGDARRDVIRSRLEGEMHGDLGEREICGQRRSRSYFVV